MKTRTNIRAGADPLQTCKQQKNYWMNQAQYMESIAANCQAYHPVYPVQPIYPPSQPTSGGGYVGGVWYADMSGTCA